jgi:protein O-mannosyl-transferase
LRRYLVLAAASLIAFGDCLRGSFHFDDYAMLANPAGPSWLLQTRPLTELTFWLNFLAGGSNPVGFHAVNLLLHVAVVCLLFDVLQDLIPREGAFLAAMLFAIHPIQCEAVAYIFARGTLLATLFCLLCWRSWRTGRVSLAVAWFGAALLSKEECVTFPFVLLLIGPRRWKPAIAMLGMAAAVGIHTVYATSMIAGSGAGFTAGVSPLDYLAAQGAVIVRYFRLLVLPWGYSIDPQINSTRLEELLAWLVLIGALIYLRKNRWFVSGMILLIPSSSVFPAADLAADRRMYLPMAAFCAGGGLLLRKVKSVYLAPVAVILIVLSIGRMEVWRTERSLWQEASKLAPGKARPAIQLARAVPPEKALEVLSHAPANADVITERGRVYLDLGRPADALREFGQALALKPGDAHAINNRGVALLALGQKEAAHRDFERALAIDPNLTDAQHNLTRATAGAK